MGHGLFAVDVLPRAHAVDDHRGVPVVGRADDDAVEVFRIEQSPVVSERLWGTARQFLSSHEVLIVDIAEGGQLDAGDGLRRPHQRPSPPARADDAEPYAVVRSQDTCPGPRHRHPGPES